jgi:putative membrane protein
VLTVNPHTATDFTPSVAPSSGGLPVRTERSAALGADTNLDPRFTFANERTFLAWTRTSLALIGAGLAVAQFVKLGVRVAPLLTGVGLIAFGAATSLTSYRQWQRNQRALQRRQPVTPCIMPHILAGGAAVFAVAAVVLAVLAFSSR